MRDTQLQPKKAAIYDGVKSVLGQVGQTTSQVAGTAAPASSAARNQVEQALMALFAAPVADVLGEMAPEIMGTLVETLASAASALAMVAPGMGIVTQSGKIAKDALPLALDMFMKRNLANVHLGLSDSDHHSDPIYALKAVKRMLDRKITQDEITLARTTISGGLAIGADALSIAEAAGAFASFGGTAV